MRRSFLTILEIKLFHVGISLIADLPKVIVILVVTSEIFFACFNNLRFVVFPRQYCPNFISKHADFVIFVYMDELLSAEYFPHNLLLIKVVKENGGIPAWLIFNPDNIAFALAANKVLHQVSRENNCLSRFTRSDIALTVICDCVNDCGVVELLLLVIVFIIQV